MTEMQPDSDVRLAIDQRGNGTPVVFTHGWADTRQVWHGVVEALYGRSRCISWDLRGHGESTIAPAGQYSRAHALQDLLSVVDLVDGPVVLAGHSLGGYLSLAFALQHPEKVTGLVLIAAGPGFRKQDAMDAWNASVDRSAIDLGVPEGQEEISKHTDSWVIDHLGDIDCPALCIIGERDKRFAASVEVFEKHLDVRASVTVADAGHMVHFKKPTEVADAIADFIAAIG
ncbi:MAG: alpha/beta fold hydrolase [Acidobacteria bacterium]|nr:alpha/beta fold hydrolase [Acidobacteriota bacterium]